MSKKKKKKKAEVDPFKDYKFVVYLRAIGNTPRGIFGRWVDIVGDRAYCRRTRDVTRADVLPALNVFDTEEAAARYLLEQEENGRETWVVQDGYREPVLLFRGKVIAYEYERHYGSRFAHKKVLRLSDNKLMDGRACIAFATKREAEKYHREAWNKARERMEKSWQEASTEFQEFMANKPRSKKKSS